MNESEDKAGPRSVTMREGSNSLREAGDLYREMSAEAKRLIRDQAAAAGSRSKASRLLVMLTLIAALLAAATMFYGAYRFPDAPIRAAGDGFVGKIGTPHSKDDYEAFLLWKTTLFATFGLVFGLGIGVAFTEHQRRRNRARRNRDIA